MHKMLQYLRKHWVAYLMVMPFTLGILIFAVYPPFYSIILSFFNVYKISDGLTEFVGINNFVNLFQDTTFLHSFVSMFALQLPRLAVNVFVPFFYAEIIFHVSDRKKQFAYRFLLLLPTVCPGIVSSLIWQNIYAYDDGILNEILKGLGIVSENINFLGYDNIIGSLIFMNFPWLAGTAGLIVLAGLINIPAEVLEAAELDGCGVMRRIFVIDLSYLIGQIKYVLVFGIINIFQDYSHQLLFAERVGTRIHVPAYYMYTLVNTNQSIGKAAAIGVFLFAIIMFITAATYRLLNSKDEEYA